MVTKLSEIEPGTKLRTALDRRVIAVLSIDHDGYAVYVGAVPGLNHDDEWRAVAKSGAKQLPEIGEAIARRILGPAAELDVPYAR
jgi:hypothetical protein